MKTLWQQRTREELLARARRLTPASEARWGKFTVDRMLAHVVDGFHMAMGDIATKPKRVPIPIDRWPLNVLFIHVVGMPKHAPTAPELLSRAPLAIDGELRELESQMARFASMAERTDWPAHPFFGRLSRRSWGVLGYKHLDHHLRQFGV
ncbi:MAG: DUF1569 domain-containing protein [Gemmatimonadaceae bacterium]|nr:DUF1569 domain-containing protein [Gemmatimonadaceae bacterium]NUQ93992.1 DUF1569 domain-containing protein [Gemmatimonadaceae bacterium]NUR17976.1 DUF1569 domain-containing protein [Gemmatimonadaceae bacterium]NUS96128.1 DUF1569 domain-containing protein [Gemmatimonadaceae bacterium]